MARLNPVTGVADSFDPNADATVVALALQADGKILAGGDFVNISGQTRNRIARLNGTTGLTDSFDPNANNRVASIAVQTNGRILVGGNFTTIGGQSRSHVARLDATTGAADSFDPNATGGSVLAMATQSDGKVLAVGGFSTMAPNGGLTVTRNKIARLETDGRLDQTVNLNAIGNFITAVAEQPDGKFLIGGLFTNILGVPRNNIARLNSDGTLDTTFNPNADAIVDSIVIQADGKILAGGTFGNIGGQLRNGIARLDPTTGAADSFNPNASDRVNAITLQTDGKILVGGTFINIGGQFRPFMARLDPATGLADSFSPSPSDSVSSIAVQTDGKILVGGAFSNSIGGQMRGRIARLDPATGQADSFNPNANLDILSIVVQPDGKILVGGNFNGVSSIGGATRNFIARLDPVTGLADSFNPNANAQVSSIALQGNGKILVSGVFSGANSIGGAMRNYIARLDSATGSADSFNPNANNIVRGIALQADGKILAGGNFSGANSIGGQARDLFARLTNDQSAVQGLAVIQPTITWTRGGGSGPQFMRVTFEQSFDNVSYSFLGNGTASGSNWTLTGLNLPTMQNLYIRARGYYRGGYLTSSGGIQESVRNAFITLPPAPSQVVSSKLHGGTSRDINLPLTGNAGIECRSGGATNDYQLVFTFPSAVTFTNAALTAGAGSVSGSSGNGTTTLTVNLTGVTNAQTITVRLSGVSDGNATGDVDVRMAVLTGDTNGDGTVNSADISQTKAKSGQATDATNFRNDANVDGVLNSADISLVKSKSGTGLLAPPAADRFEWPRDKTLED